MATKETRSSSPEIKGRIFIFLEVDTFTLVLAYLRSKKVPVCQQVTSFKLFFALGWPSWHLFWSIMPLCGSLVWYHLLPVSFSWKGLRIINVLVYKPISRYSVKQQRDLQIPANRWQNWKTEDIGLHSADTDRQIHRFLELSCDDLKIRNAAMHIVALPIAVNAACRATSICNSMKNTYQFTSDLWIITSFLRIKAISTKDLRILQANTQAKEQEWSNYWNFKYYDQHHYIANNLNQTHIRSSEQKR